MTKYTLKLSFQQRFSLITRILNRIASQWRAEVGGEINHCCYSSIAWPRFHFNSGYVRPTLHEQSFSISQVETKLNKLRSRDKNDFRGRSLNKDTSIHSFNHPLLYLFLCVCVLCLSNQFHCISISSLLKKIRPHVLISIGWDYGRLDQRIFTVSTFAFDVAKCFHIDYFVLL